MTREIDRLGRPEGGQVVQYAEILFALNARYTVLFDIAASNTGVGVCYLTNPGEESYTTPDGRTKLELGDNYQAVKIVTDDFGKAASFFAMYERTLEKYSKMYPDGTIARAFNRQFLG